MLPFSDTGIDILPSFPSVTGVSCLVASGLIVVVVVAIYLLKNDLVIKTGVALLIVAIVVLLIGIVIDVSRISARQEKFEAQLLQEYGATTDEKARSIQSDGTPFIITIDGQDPRVVARIVGDKVVLDEVVNPATSLPPTKEDPS